ncbi:MAG: hypothetical protein EOP06_09150 [Proteobacteria bacterium]|nr:MAG: hypothetical protein EOP06_09150 [Pseudomonadota bacterium]
MSNTQFVFLEKSKVPSRERWQASIEAAGFDLELNRELKEFEDSGFSPCKLNGFDSGFEIYYGDAAELLDDFPNLAAFVATKNYCIMFRWGSDIAEWTCVQIASYTLSKDCGAIVSYEGQAPLSSDELRRSVDQFIPKGQG